MIGATDPEKANKKPQDSIQVQDLYATILKVLGVDYEQECPTPIGRPMAFSDGEPIERLL